MLKRFFKRVVKEGVKINLLTVGIGVFSYTVAHKFILECKKSAVEENRKVLSERNLTYDYFKNKFSENLNNKNSKSK